MWIVKYDLAKLKHEYITWDYASVNAFLIQKWLKNKISWKSVKWWTKDKQALKARATEQALKKVATKLSNKLEPSSEFLLWNIAKAIELTKVKLDQMEQKWNINVKDLNTIRWMNRIQNWQPTTYVKEESDVNQNIRIEWIHIVMWWNAIDSSKSDENNA